MNVRSLAGLVALTAVSTAVPAAGAEAAPAAPSAPAAAAAAALPAAGSWAVGHSVVTLASRSSASTARLVLLSPSGAVVRTIAGSVPAGISIEDVQHDARRVITSQSVGSATRFTVRDVAAGTSKSFALPGGASAFFTDKGILTQEAGSGRISVRDYTGRWQKTLPTLRGGGHLEVSPGGTLLMQETSNGIALRRASNGSVVRTISNPRGATCSPLGLWGQGYVKAACAGTSKAEGWVRVSSTTSSTTIDVTPRSLYSFSDAWPTTGRRSVEAGPDDPQVGSLTGSTFNPYFSKAGVTFGLGAHGSRVWAQGAGAVLSKDVRTGQVVTVAGPGSALGGYVNTTRLIDTVN